MFLQRIVLAFALCIPTLPIAAQDAKPLTNQDVIKLVKAKIGDEIVITKINQSKNKFDLSTDGIVQLKEAGVSDKVLQVMMNQMAGDPTLRGAGGRPAQSTPPAASSSPQTLDAGSIAQTPANGVFFFRGTNRVQMKQAAPSARADVGKDALKQAINPFSKSKSLTAFNGNRAQLRLDTTSPTFEIVWAGDLNPSDYIFLVKLKAKSDRREIETARIGLTGFSQGFRKEDLIPI
nr:hypothetical protein [Acidobacteriota bacterium]